MSGFRFFDLSGRELASGKTVPLFNLCMRETVA